MRKKYQNPEIQIISLEIIDVIRTSDINKFDSFKNDIEWVFLKKINRKNRSVFSLRVFKGVLKNESRSSKISFGVVTGI